MISFLVRGVRWALPLFFLALLAFGDHGTEDVSPKREEVSPNQSAREPASTDLSTELSNSAGLEILQGFEEVTNAVNGMNSVSRVGESSPAEQ